MNIRDHVMTQINKHSMKNDLQRKRRERNVIDFVDMVVHSAWR